MDKENIAWVERHLRERAELREVGELCIEGKYYWAVPKIWLSEDTKKAKALAHQMKKHFDKERNNG